jgi:putative tryptophan/tyrosine transport system substrate-binding protein
MRRRDFLGVVSGAAATAWPLATRAQDKIRRIGVLMNYVAGDSVAQARLSKFMTTLEARGWTQGRNIEIETRWADGNTDRVRKYAEELVALSPDLIFVTTTPGVSVLKRTTNNIPIVFANVVDPVGSGLVASMSHPGGNATGFVPFEYATAAKWLELLKEMVPTVTRAAVLRDSAVSTGIGLFAAIQAVGSLGIELSVIDVGDPAEMERGIAAFAAKPNGGLIVTVSQFASTHAGLIAALAARDRLPAVYPFRYFVDLGGLISYGPGLFEEYRGAAEYVDRILRGEKAAELPVQSPTKYELAINLKTANALGITAPPILLARADEVIE